MKSLDAITKRLGRRHYIALALILAVLLVILGIKGYFYVSYLLGNDLIVELESGLDMYRTGRGETATTDFTAKVTTNPLCDYLCTAVFEDISRNLTLEKVDFIAETSLQFTMSAPAQGIGLKLYRLDLSCHNIATFFCHTDERPSTRNRIVTLRYGLSAQEQEQIVDYSEILNNLSSGLEDMKGKVMAATLADFTVSTPGLDLTRQNAQQRLNNLRNHLSAIDWDSQDIDMISSAIDNLSEESATARAAVDVFLNQTEETIRSYNNAVGSLKSSAQTLNALVRENNTDSALAVAIANTISSFNRQPPAEDIERLEQAANYWESRTGSLETYIKNQTQSSALERVVLMDIASQALCQYSDFCPVYPAIAERVNQTFDAGASCLRAEFLRSGIATASINVTGNLNLPTDLPQGMNSEQVSRILAGIRPVASVRDIERLVRGCEVIRLGYEEVIVPQYSLVQMPEPVQVSLNISFGEPRQQCSIFGKDYECCEGCGAYPVLLLHGHAFSKDLAADYSLEGFNNIQRELEKDGFLNAGSITLFTEQKDTDLGLIPVPLVFRGSYYFDVYGEPDNYVSVPAKSESIDTYAIRLRELVDMLAAETGRDKVRIVAFSMGGLVARRYVQIFGAEKVDLLVLIGTPNKGIVGEVADYCPVLGEKLECRDMNSESLFINKLNRDPLPDIPVYNIVGTGCMMREGVGDGIVLEENAVLDGADNIIINGTCRSKIMPLHLDLRNVEMYPRVYNSLLKILTSP